MFLEHVNVARIDLRLLVTRLVSSKSQSCHVDGCLRIDVIVQEALHSHQLLILLLYLLQLVILLLHLGQFLVYSQHLLQLCFLDKTIIVIF